jgi:hypothetical protein
MQWLAKVLDHGSLRPYDARSDLAAPEATFIFLWDGKEQRYLVIIDLEFRDGCGRIPHSKVLKKFRSLGFCNFSLYGGGVICRSMIVGNTIASYNSEALGEIPFFYHYEVQRCLNLHGSK